MHDQSLHGSATSLPKDGHDLLPASAAVRTLAREVVIRLSRSSALGTAAEIAAETAEVEACCSALVGPDPELALAMARQALAEGLSFDALCETRLAPAARRLGTLWEEDRLSFAEVTLAANRLFSVLRSLAHRPTPRADTRFAVFTVPPGEEHVLGVTMAAERARGAGWDVALMLGLPHDQLVARIADAAPDVIGLSVSSPRGLLPLTRLVVALRIAAPASPIVVSGPGVAQVQEPLPGVDLLTPDYEVAMKALSRLAG
jgi:MerR family transcriptional regulator, light-induced transcriptional regulator